MSSKKNKTDLDTLIIGAGFSGLYLLDDLRNSGLNVHVVEAADGPGGVWRANCYPGARVDTHCEIYQFSREDLWGDWNWLEKFPSWREMQRYFEYVTRKLKLDDDISYNTKVVSAFFEQASNKWLVTYEDGSRARCSILNVNTGFGSKPFTPVFPGQHRFSGACHHSARWPRTGVSLQGKRVAVIGTGASGVQIAQEASRVADQVFVFQRTPNLAIPMQQRKLSIRDNDEMKKNYPQMFNERGGSFAGFGFDTIPLNATEVSEQERNQTYEQLWNTGGFRFWLANYKDMLFDEVSNKYAYDFWRRKVHERVENPEVAERLAPTIAPHPFGVKRPSLEQWYYDMFNQENVELVDMNATGISEITERGIVTSDGREREVDVVALATGFDAVTGGLTSIDIRGTNGKNFAEAWVNGVHTHLGVATSGFPNLIFGYGPQSPGAFCNGPSSAEYQGALIAKMIKHIYNNNIKRVEATPEAEQRWRSDINEYWETTLFPKAKSWYTGENIPGKKVEPLNFPIGLPSYLERFETAINQNYYGFKMD